MRRKSAPKGRRSVGLLAASFAAALFLLAADAGHSQAPNGPARPRGPGGSAPESEPRWNGEILVKFRNAVDADEATAGGGIAAGRRPGLAAALNRHQVTGGQRLFPRVAFRRLDRVVKMVSEQGRQDPARLREVLESLRARPEVEYAEPNITLQAYWNPNDPYLNSSGAWGQAFGDLWGLQKIGAPAAWDLSRGTGVVVAVLDTGVYFDHPDLAGNIWFNPGETGLDAQGWDKRTNGLDDDGDGYVDDWRGWDFIGPGWGSDNDPFDEHGHGTHVAGTIAAVGNNGIGVIGVAPSAKVMAVRVLNAYGSGSLDGIAAGIIYAANRGARVLNLSLGTTFPDVAPQTLRDAIAYAHDVKGAVVVAAAGNSASDVGTEAQGYFPAAFRDVVTVAATNSADQLASFSNFGAAIDLGAPGGGDTDSTGTVVQPSRSIVSLLSVPANSGMTGSGQLVVGDGYLRQSGTSMASPHVAGAAALVIAQHPEYSAEQVRQALRRTGASYNLQVGYGHLSALTPLQQVFPPLASRLVGPIASKSAPETAAIVGTVGGNLLNFWALEYGTGALPTEWSLLMIGSSSGTETTLYNWPLASVPDGTYTLRLTAYDSSNGVFEDRMPFTVDSVSITGPSPTSITPVRGGDAVSVTGSVETADFQSFRLKVVGARSGVLANPNVTLTGGGLARVHEGPLAVWNTAGVAADHYQVCVVVTSTDGSTKEECVSTIVDPALHPGWPQALPATGLYWSPESHITVADVDGDGAKELLIGAGYEVRVLRHDGTLLTGWPRYLYGAIINSPAFGDVTGDGVGEVVAADGSGYVHVMAADGSPLPGWPRPVLTGMGSVALVDLDGDGVREIVAVESGFNPAAGNVTVVKGDGSALPGWPRSPAPSRQFVPPAFGDVDGDGTTEIVLATMTTPTELYVLRADGTSLPGWPITLDSTEPSGQWTSSRPATVDLNGDGASDIVIGTLTGKVFALRGNGTAISGWPVQLVADLKLNPPAIGDIDGDGVPEIVIGGNDSWWTNWLYALRSNGTTLSGWPRMLDFWLSGRLFFGYGAPSLADVNGDGRADVLVSSDADYLRPFALQAYDWTGASLPTFPRPTLDIGGHPSNAPAVADLDGDGQLELAWLDYSLNLYVWDLTAPATAVAPWPMVLRDPQHTGRGPSPPRLTLTILGVLTGRGSVSGVPSGACNNLDGVPSRSCTLNYAPDTVVTLTAVAHTDSVFVGWGGACSGTPTSCQVTMSASRTVTASFRASNLPPTANAGGPYSGNKNQSISFNGSGSSDPEGSPLTYSWTFGDGGSASGVAPGHVYTKGGTFNVSLTVRDGAKTSTPSSTTVTVVDAVPPAAVSDLRISNSTNHSIELIWTATGDDGNVGIAAQYDLRYSTAPIDASNFDSAPRQTSIIAPRMPGTTDVAVVNSLLPPNRYYFALKVLDAGGNASPISNLVNGVPIGLTVFHEDFEAGLSRWTLTGDPQVWEWNGAVSRSPSHSLRRRSVSGVSNTHAAVVGPINLVGARSPFVSFQLALVGCFGGGFETANMSVSSDGGATWGGGLSIQGSWPASFTHFGVDVSQYNEKSVLLRFTFESCSASGGSYLDDVLVTADSVAPIAKHGGPYSAFKRQTVTFNGSASISPTGAPLTYAWTFGDGTTGTGPQPTHAYTTPGTFNVGLTVSDGTSSASASTTATITNRAPTAVVGGPYTGTEGGAAVAFNGSASSDPDGDPLTYSWNFGDGFGASGVAPGRVYTRGGTFTVTLSVHDGNTSSAVSSTTATITPVLPAPVANLSATPTGARAIRLNWTATGDDGNLGTASSYDLRYSLAPIDAASFASATQVTGEPTPKTAGSAETMTVSAGLAPNTRYYFALKVADDSGQWSAISNVPNARTQREQALFSDDFEAGLGNWTIAGSNGVGGPALWHIGTHRFNSPTHALYYGTEPAHNYNTGARNMGSATTGPINLAGALAPRLNFRYYVQKEATLSYDIARVLISTNGTTWTQLASYLSTSSMTSADFDLAAYQNQNVRIRFDFDTIDSTVNGTEGWVIDDVSVGAAVPNRAPVANAGPDQALPEGTAVTLAGSASSDPDGDPLTYTWRDAQSNVVATTATATLSLPIGSHTFTLTVSDGDLSATDTVQARVLGQKHLNLSVASVESGGGSVTFSPTADACVNNGSAAPVDCQREFLEGTAVTLSAVPAPDSVFEGWVGPCAGQPYGPLGGTCQITLDDDAAVGGSFRGPQPVTIDIASLENGTGLVYASDGTVSWTCTGAAGSPQSCTQLVRIGSTVSLSAMQGLGSVFEGWVGVCAGQPSEPYGGSCKFQVTDDVVVGARFRGPQQVTIEIASLENGVGQVFANDGSAWWTCNGAPGSPQTCTRLVQIGATVELMAMPGPDSAFDNWVGVCQGPYVPQGSSCRFQVTDDAVVGVGFRGPQQVTIEIASLENGVGQVLASDDNGSWTCSGTPGSPQTCSRLVRIGSMVSVYEMPGPDSVFEGWVGVCENQPWPCRFPVMGHMVLGASFRGPQRVTIDIASLENGAGQVFASDGTVSWTCSGAPGSPQTCSQLLRIGSTVNLSAMPGPDSVFEGWVGVCAGQPHGPLGGTCQFVVIDDGSLGATFRGPRQLRVDITSLENGGGTVGNTYEGTNWTCTATIGATQSCTQNVRLGTSLDLAALAAPDSVITGWSEACAEQPFEPHSSVCTVILTENRVVGVSFLGPQPLTLTVAGEGSGQVQVEPALAPCANQPGEPNTCDYSLRPGSGVQLSAVPASDSVFQGWQGVCAGQGAVCELTVNADASTTATFVLANHAPTALAGGPYTGFRNEAVGFSGAGSTDPDGNPLSYAWDFGDGATGTGVAPRHAYATLGTFTVTLSVNDGTVSSPLVTSSVTIGNRAPVANPGSGYAGVRGQAIAFSGAASTDPDGDALTYEWTFGDGTPAASGVAPTHAYATLGSFTVTLRVHDGHDYSTLAPVIVPISNRLPVASAGGPYSGTRLATIAFNGGGSSDPDGDPLTYEWSFGDGGIGVGPTPSHTYTQIGAFTVSLVVRDGIGSSSPATSSVQISNVSPSVSLTGPAGGSIFTAPATIPLTAVAGDGDGSIAKVEFYAGAAKVGESLTPPYVLAWSGVAAGTYVLTARAIDDSGAGASSAPVSVTVNALPSVALTAPANGAQFAAPASITLSANASDSDGTIAQVEFFQGATSLGVDTTSPYSVSWNGVAVGSYTLTARATDNLGALATSSGVAVKVTATLAPTADAYVRGGSSNANDNFGTATTLTVQENSSSSSDRWTYLKIDLASLPSITNAKLRLFGGLSATTGTTVQTAVYPVSNTSWTETGITWNNKPASGSTALATVTIVNNSTTARWYEWDVTAYLQAERAAGRNVVTLVLKNLANSSPFASFSSKEASTVSNRPGVLVVP